MPSDGSDMDAANALTDEELGQVRSYRERDEFETSAVRAVALPPQGLSPEELAQVTDQEILGMISPEARDLVVNFEIGSRAAYDRAYKHPVWPGGASGVTIGIGYDIGHCGLDDFTRSWKDKLPEETFEAAG